MALNRNGRCLLLILAASLLLTAPNGVGQQISPLPSALNSEANLVRIEVQALVDGSRQPYKGLSCADFVVLDLFLPTEIVACDQVQSSRDILLLLDLSGGNNDDGILSAAPAILEILRYGDRAAVMWFSDGDARLALRLTGDRKELARILRETLVHEQESGKRSKHSHLLDALYSGAEYLAENADEGRPLIFVVTHNRERGSTATTSGVANALLESSIGLEAVTIPQTKRGSGPGVGIGRNTSLGFPGWGGGEQEVPDRPTGELEDLFSVQPVVSKIGGQVVDLASVNTRRAPRGQPTRREWNADTVAAIIERELLARLRDPFVLSVRGASTPKRTFRPLVVKLTEEARVRNPDATLWFRWGYFTKGNDIGTP